MLKSQIVHKKYIHEEVHFFPKNFGFWNSLQEEIVARSWVRANSDTTLISHSFVFGGLLSGKSTMQSFFIQVHPSLVRSSRGFCPFPAYIYLHRGAGPSFFIRQCEILAFFRGLRGEGKLRTSFIHSFIHSCIV